MQEMNFNPAKYNRMDYACPGAFEDAVGYFESLLQLLELLQLLQLPGLPELEFESLELEYSWIKAVTMKLP